MKVIGKPLTEPTDEQVQQESQVLGKILPADRVEYLMDYALRMGISPFKALDNLLFRGMTNIIGDDIKAQRDKLIEDITGENHAR